MSIKLTLLKSGETLISEMRVSPDLSKVSLIDIFLCSYNHYSTTSPFVQDLNPKSSIML